MLKYFTERHVHVFLIAFLTQIFIFSAPAVSAERIALVIGNSSYSHASYLANPGNDARAVSAVLRSDGYDVTTELDLGVEAMRRALGVFASKASTADIALIYYAGHGIEVGGKNFLIPTDARLMSDAGVEFEATELDLLVRAAERAKVLGLVILDACRDNPFAAKMRTVGGARSVGRGLAPVKPLGSNTLIAYAAAAGAVANDGAGTNSPYTAAFLEAWSESAREVRVFFGSVRDKVKAKTGGRQLPFTYGSLGGTQVLLKDAVVQPVPLPTVIPVAPAVSQNLSADRAKIAYESAKQLGTRLAFEAVVTRYPGTFWSDLAKAELANLTLPPPTIHPENKPEIATSTVPPVSAGGSCDGVIMPSGWECAVGSDGKVKHRRLAVAPPAPTAVPVPSPPSRLRSYFGISASKWLSGGSGEGGSSFREGVGLPEMVVIPSGSFMMGSPEAETTRFEVPDKYASRERPQRIVRIPGRFALGRTEVTVGEWRRFVGETGHSTGGSCSTYEDGKWESRSGLGWDSPGFDQGEDHPVVCVNWNDAQAYVEWVNGKSGGSAYRLPSESEWEYSARGGTVTARYWGDDAGATEQCRYGNGADAASKRVYESFTVANCDDGYAHTSPVGRYGKNGFGLSDTLGNVLELVEDCFVSDYSSAPVDGSVYSPQGCSQRVLRGGSWFFNPRNLRSANRFRGVPDNRSNVVGFRLARTLTP